MALTPGVQISKGIQPTDPVPVDSWSGPYEGSTEVAALTAANSSISSAVRFKSLEVRLIINGSSKKYWYKNGITDSDLIEYSPSTSDTSIDTGIRNLSSGWVGGNDAYTNLVSNSSAYLSAVDLSFLSVSGNWDSAYTTVSSNSSNNWDNSKSNEYTHTNFLPLTGGTINGDITITGNLSALGTTTQIDTQVFVTSAVSVTNAGTGPALTVKQTGAQDIATFFDDSNTALIIKDGGNVGIGQTNPYYKLEVQGGNTLVRPYSQTASSEIVAGDALYVDVTNPGAGTTNWSGTLLRQYGKTATGTSFGVSNAGLGMLLFQNTENCIIGTNSSSLPLIFANGNGEKMRIASTGKVGIGTTAPNESLTVSGNISATGLVYASSGNSSNWNSAFTTVQSDSANWENTLAPIDYNYSSIIVGPYSFVLERVGTVNSKPYYRFYYSGNNGPELVQVYWFPSEPGWAFSWAGNEETETYISTGDTQYPWQSTWGSGYSVSQKVSDLQAQPLQLTSSYGSSISAARADHVHPYPTASQVSAVSLTEFKSLSSNWQSSYTTVSSNSASYATISFANNKFLPLSGGTISGNLTITGNLSTLGTNTQIDTQVFVTSAVSVTNTGTGPALTVKQTGAQDIATFFDDSNTALIIKDGGNVGIGASTPNEKLTVSGNISATGTINNITLGYGTGNINTNTAVGKDVLFSNTTGSYNTGVGENSLYYNKTGYRNIGVGNGALTNNIIGYENTAIGTSSLSQNTSGYNNTAIGSASLFLNLTGANNVAIGLNSLYNNKASYNIAIGQQTLFTNSLGTNNVACGHSALYYNTIGNYNIAIGQQTLFTNTSGTNNVATGYQSLLNNTDGDSNVAYGTGALNANTIGNSNLGIGHNAGSLINTGNSNICIGGSSNPSSSSGSNQIVIGINGTGIGDNSVVLGTSTTTKTELKGNVGIGTSTPNEKLTVSGNISATGNVIANGQFLFADGTVSAPSIANNGDTNNGIYFPATDTLGLVTGGVERVRITSSGQLSSTNDLYAKNGIFNNQSGTAGGQITLSDPSGVGAWEIDNNNRQLRFFRDKGVQDITGFSLLTSGDIYLNNGDIIITSNASYGNLKIGSSSDPFYGYASTTTFFGIGNGVGSSSSNSDNTIFGAYNGNVFSTVGSSHNTIVGHNNGNALAGATGNALIGSYMGQSITSGAYNTFIGYSAGNTTTGDSNIFIGGFCGPSSNTANTICIGDHAGTNISNNTSMAIGMGALQSGATPNTGGNNIAIGQSALNSAAGTATGNVALGNVNLASTTTGSYNVALGTQVLQDNTTGTGNIGIGYQANLTNTTGQYNIAIGHQALDANTLGYYNIAIGRSALGAYNNSFGTAGNNTAIGYNSLLATVPTSNANGINNTALGHSAGDSNTIGSNNTFIGYDAGGSVALSGTNNTCIGNASYPSGPGAANEITLGNASITSLRCADTAINSLSDGRDKTKVENLQLGLDFINSLRPVKFEWKTREGSAKDGTQEAGFIAQELLEAEEKTNCKDYLRLVYEANPDRLEAAYARLIPVLVKSIQDLSEQKKKLTEEIEFLKSKIN